MSLARLVYYSAVIGGWAAFLGWLVAECLVLRGQGAGGGRVDFSLIMAGALVGGAIGAGINVLAGISNTQWKQVAKRIAAGLVVGSLGGAVGIFLGNLIYLLYPVSLMRALGFMVLGLGVGVVDGLYERSASKIRNGVIGGLIGGLAGGILFDPLTTVISSGAGIAARATAFVILGICIGALIGLTQVVFRQAWLTVLDGYRPGRQLILSQGVTILGRGDHLPLPFMGPNNRELEAEHARIARQADGSYTIEDNRSKLGLSVNHQSVQQGCPLRDGDVIKLGGNFIRFNERRRRDGGLPAPDSSAVQTPAAAPAKAPPPPPPPPRKPTPPGGAAPRLQFPASGPGGTGPAGSSSGQGGVSSAAPTPKPAASPPGPKPPPPPPRKK
jgi:hypothetical protein